MDEHTKRPVYNGYEERIMTGQELFDYFANAYECFGRHHQQYSGRAKLTFKCREFAATPSRKR